MSNSTVDMPTVKSLLVQPEEIDKLIVSSTAKASTLGALPIPLVDIAGTTYIQVSMVNKMAEMYGLDTDDNKKLIISSLISALSAKLISEAISSLAASTKLEKVLGESLIKATISGFITTVTGEVYNDHFKKGGHLGDIDVDAFLSYIKDQWNSDRIKANNILSNMMDGFLDKYHLS